MDVMACHAGCNSCSFFDNFLPLLAGLRRSWDITVATIHSMSSEIVGMGLCIESGI